MKKNPREKKSVNKPFGVLKTGGSLLKALAKERKWEIERDERKFQRRKMIQEKGKPS